jgi:hypothetical protein
MMRIISSVALLLLLFAAPALCQTTQLTPRQIEAKNEIDEGARAYRDAKFYEAQKHFERALALDPGSRNAPFFIARAIHSQFKPGIDTPENVAIARAAIAAYHRVLNSDPADAEAYNATVYIYDQIKDEAGLRQWLMSRATDTQLPAAQRTSAYTLMASREWKCSYAITERKEHKGTVFARRRARVRYLKPADEAEFHKTKRCAERGMELIEQGVGLDGESLQAWAYKTNLLRELVKLAEMEGQSKLKADYQKRARDAQRRTDELSAQEKRTRDAHEKKAPK